MTVFKFTDKCLHSTNCIIFLITLTCINSNKFTTSFFSSAFCLFSSRIRFLPLCPFSSSSTAKRYSVKQTLILNNIYSCPFLSTFIFVLSNSIKKDQFGKFWHYILQVFFCSQICFLFLIWLQIPGILQFHILESLIFF